MQILEKILQEIEQRFFFKKMKAHVYENEVYVPLQDILEIIRSHMEDAPDTNVGKNESVSNPDKLDDAWIPVEKRLPDKHAEVLVSFEDGFNGVVAWYSDISKTWWNANTERLIEAKIIAWQPLPAPYQGGRDEQSNIIT